MAVGGEGTNWACDYIVGQQSQRASDEGPGTAELAQKTSAKATGLARAGDTVVVNAGLYRERVKLSRRGTPTAPITFVADPPGSVVVSGADIIKGWRRVFIGNGNIPGTDHNWGDAGIKPGESMNCVVAYNTWIGNKDGITIREGEGRPSKTEDHGDVLYHCRGNVIAANLCADNDGFQISLWYDNGHFGTHPSDKKKFASQEASAAQLDPKKVFDPMRTEHIIDRKLYHAKPGQKIALYGVPWRSKHQQFQDLAAFAAKTGFDRNSGVGDPSLISPAAAIGGPAAPASPRKRGLGGSRPRGTWTRGWPNSCRHGFGKAADDDTRISSRLGPSRT